MIKKIRLKRIGLLSAMKIGGVVSTVLGFILGTVWGVIIAFFSSLVGTAMSMDTSGVGILWIIVIPIFFAFMCGVLGVGLSFLIALIHNIAAGVFGGIEIETEDLDKKVNNDVYGEM